MSGIVYLLTNPAMPGLVKIGKTTRGDPQLRMGDLYTTGVPLPFDCDLAMEVEDETAVETAFHQAFGPDRINPRREFFKIDVTQAEALLRLLGKRDVTPDVVAGTDDVNVEEKQAADNYKKRRPNLNFKDMGIEQGSILDFTEGDEQVVVVNERRVSHNNRETSLTAITAVLLNRGYEVQPSPFWRYQGRLLSELYEETYTHVD